MSYSQPSRAIAGGSKGQYSTSQLRCRDLRRDIHRGKSEINAEKVSVEQAPQPKEKFKDTPFAKALPTTVGITLGMGFGPGICKAIGETTGWGTYAVATICVGSLIMGAAAGLIMGVLQIVMSSPGKEVND